MLTKVTTTIAATLAALYTLAGTAMALPGEGFGVDPYGIPIPDGLPAGLPAADPVVQTVTGMTLSPFVFAALIVLTAAVMALVGYRAGAIKQRRLALR